MTTYYNPYTYVPDPDTSRAVFNGFIFIGRVDTDPTQTQNQIPVSVVQENGQLVAIEQPIRTGRGGIPVYQGNPAQIDIAASEYSVTVQDRSGVQQYYSPRATGLAPFSAENAVTHATYADFIASFNEARSFVKTGDRAGSEWRKVDEATYNAFPGSQNNTKAIDSGGGFWVLMYDAYVNIIWTGAVDGGTTDATLNINDALMLDAPVFIPEGLFLINPNTRINLTTGDVIYGAGENRSLLLCQRGIGGSAIGRIFNASQANTRIDDCLIRDIGIFLNHNHTDSFVSTELQIGVNLSHISRTTVTRCYIGNLRHGQAATLFPNALQIPQAQRGRAVLIGTFGATDTEYAGGDENRVTDVTARYIERAISLDDDALSDSDSASFGNVIRDNDIAFAEIGINQDRSTGNGNTIRDNNITDIQQSAGSTNDTFLYRFGGTENNAGGGYTSVTEANVTQAIRFTTDAHKNIVDPFRHNISDSKMAQFDNTTTDGPNIVRYFSEDDDEYKVLHNGNESPYLIQTISNTNGFARIYSDGYKEQWGTFLETNSRPFPVPFDQFDTINMVVSIRSTPFNLDLTVTSIPLDVSSYQMALDAVDNPPTNTQMTFFARGF